MSTTKPKPDRFWSKVDRTDACWIWTASCQPTGYGQFMVRENGKSKNKYAHRVSYELSFGPIPDGLHIDHLCRNRKCVRPEHLEAVTCKENVSRGKRLITHCPKGHEYTEDNTYYNTARHRFCRECSRINAQGYRDARSQKEASL